MDEDDIIDEQSNQISSKSSKGPKKPMLAGQKDKVVFDSASYFKEKEKAEKEETGKDGK